MVDQASPVANSAEVQDVKTTIEKIHDLTREKSRIITDTNYKKYLPKKHKILRNIFQFWLLTIFLAVICTIVYFFPGLEAFKPLAYFGMIACFVYTLFAALIALVLFLTNYTLPIAVTNEVKARMVLNINRKLDTLKGMLQQGFGNAIIQLSIHEGKFDLDHSSASVDSFIKNNFPSGQYIKEILTDEIISKVQADIKHYIDKLSIVAKGHIKNQPVKVTQIASKMALKPEVVVQLFKHMLTKRTIDGMLTELDQEFVPESFMAGQDFGADDGTGSKVAAPGPGPLQHKATRNNRLANLYLARLASPARHHRQSWWNPAGWRASQISSRSRRTWKTSGARSNLQGTCSSVERSGSTSTGACPTRWTRNLNSSSFV